MPFGLVITGSRERVLNALASKGETLYMFTTGPNTAIIDSLLHCAFQGVGLLMVGAEEAVKVTVTADVRAGTFLVEKYAVSLPSGMKDTDGNAVTSVEQLEKLGAPLRKKV